MRMPALVRRKVLRLFLLPAVLVMAVLAWSATALAVETTTTTTSTATSATGPQAPAADAGLVPPAAGFSLLNPGLKTDQMDVQIWPEYDEKAVLVFLSFSLPPEVQLPATFKFAVPKGAVIAGIGEKDPGGSFKYNYANSYPPVETGEAWDIATIQVKEFRSLQIDYYYDPGLPESAGQRLFPLLLQLPLDVDTLLVHVQQPARSTDFKVQPDMQGVGAAGDGFTYAVSSYSGVKAGTTLGQVVSYNKADGGLSIDSAESGSTKISTNTVLLAAILVVVVCAGALVVYRLYRNTGKTKRSKGRPVNRPGSKSAAAAQKRPAAKVRDAERKQRDANELICADCGEALGKKDRYCPNCGTPRED